MQVGMIGLGRMGGNMAERLRARGFDVVGYDRDADVSQTSSLEDLVERLAPPRAVWLMVPAGAPTEQTIDALARALDRGDLVVDGGNSNFRDTIRRAGALADAGIDLADAGTSGGVWGLTEGYCLMVGATEETYRRIEPILGALATDGGHARVGPPGSGHFVKMVHNAIEYGMLQAYAEGFELLESSKVYPDLDLARIAELWRHGSVVRSWLLDLTARALSGDPRLSSVRGYVEDSGEGRWAVIEAIEQEVSIPVTALSLLARFASRREDAFSMRLIAALRSEFGGHSVKGL